MSNKKSYEEEIYRQKRGFTIIGLTGFTGSGCTTAARILEQAKAPILPAYGQIKSFIHKEKFKKYEYNKVEMVWNSISKKRWKPYTVIETAKVIFALAFLEAHKNNKKYGDHEWDSFVDFMKSSSVNRREIKYLKYLKEDKPLGGRKAKDLLDAMNSVSNAYNNFKNKDLKLFISTLQLFGDRLRAFNKCRPNKKKEGRKARSSHYNPKSNQERLKSA
ncbi:MAG: hypothetical protein HQL53_06390 [Magnetococcales bacterium]|nr:hypothetical protein [Magnetococcales bacterium]